MPNQNEQTGTEDTRNQAAQSQKDDPRVAPESGEPGLRHARGHGVDEVEGDEDESGKTGSSCSP